MRTIYFDFSNDPVTSQKTFGGYEGEHNASVLSVNLPPRLTEEGINEYRFIFSNALGEQITSPPVESSGGVVEIELWKQLMVAPVLKSEVAAYKVVDGESSFIGKTAPMTMLISGEIHGNPTEESDRGTLVISGIRIDDNGHLVVTFEDGSSQDLGGVRGDVVSVNSKTGVVTLTGTDIKVSASSTKSISAMFRDQATDISDVANATAMAQSAASQAIGIAHTAESEAGNALQATSEINKLIPSAASQSNQLADKAYVGDSINSVTAYYITKNANGDQFTTKADLDSAEMFFSGGTIRMPLTRNDYCIVLADESKINPITHVAPTTRYIFNNGWEYQYTVNETALTEEQMVALNSGITAQKVSKYEGYETEKQNKLTAGENIKINGNEISATGGIPKIVDLNQSGEHTYYEVTADNQSNEIIFELDSLGSKNISELYIRCRIYSGFSASGKNINLYVNTSDTSTSTGSSAYSTAAIVTTTWNTATQRCIFAHLTALQDSLVCSVNTPANASGSGIDVELYSLTTNRVGAPLILPGFSKIKRIKLLSTPQNGGPMFPIGTKIDIWAK